MNINFEVKRHRLSATQGEAEVFVTGLRLSCTKTAKSGII